MHRPLRYTALTIVVVLLAGPRMAAQKPQQVLMKILGANGAPITDLKPGDLKLTEDGVACKVLKVELAGGALKVQVLVDNGEITTNPINGLRDGLQGFFDKIPQTTEMALYTTSPQSRPIVRSTTDRQKLLGGIALVTPDHSAGAFFDSLLDAVDRVDSDKAPGTPVIMMIGSNAGAETIRDRDVQELQQKIVKHGITVHVALMLTSNLSDRTGAQQEIGTALTKLTGGRYETFNSTTRFATLLPEYGARIAESGALSQYQYRITYEPPAKRSAAPKVAVAVERSNQ